MKNILRKSPRISEGNLEIVAAADVARALAARQAQMQTLSAAEISQVSGGLAPLLPIDIAGGIFREELAQHIALPNVSSAGG